MSKFEDKINEEMCKIKTVNCAICNKEITQFEQGMWDGGTVDKLLCPYGSNKDGDVYIIGVCDDCLDKNKNIKYLGDYIYGTVGRK